MSVIFLHIVLLTAAALSLLALCRFAKRRWLIWRFFKENQLQTILQDFAKAYQGIDGFQASKLGRLEYDAFSLTYGEIDPVSFAALLTLLELKDDSVWLDLGSGVGKSVLLVALLYPVKQSIGVEILPPLHALAESAKGALTNPFLQDRVALFCQNFMDFNVRQATHIFINGAGFFGENQDALEQLLQQAAPGTQVISVSKKLHLPSYELTHQTRMKTSWGVSHVFIFQKHAEQQF